MGRIAEEIFNDMRKYINLLIPQFSGDNTSMCNKLIELNNLICINTDLDIVKYTDNINIKKLNVLYKELLEPEYAEDNKGLYIEVNDILQYIEISSFFALVTINMYIVNNKLDGSLLAYTTKEYEITSKGRIKIYLICNNTASHEIKKLWLQYIIRASNYYALNGVCRKYHEIAPLKYCYGLQDFFGIDKMTANKGTLLVDKNNRLGIYAEDNAIRKGYKGYYIVTLCKFAKIYTYRDNDYCVKIENVYEQIKGFISNELLLSSFRENILEVLFYILLCRGYYQRRTSLDIFNKAITNQNCIKVKLIDNDINIMMRGML